MKTIELTCPVCQSRFDRPLKEYNRSQKKGKPSYCSRKCSSKVNIANIPKETMVTDHLRLIVRSDEYSPFRFHYRNAKRRNKEFNLTLEYLKELWEKQNGRCSYTGWKLKNLPNLSYANQLPLTPDRASLDRIDSSKGYVKGNVQYVSYMAQCAKHEFTEKDLYKFCEAVVQSS